MTEKITKPEPMSDVVKACEVLAIYHEMMIEHVKDDPMAAAIHTDAAALMKYFAEKERYEESEALYGK
jgi:hypothetical protein